MFVDGTTGSNVRSINVAVRVQLITLKNLVNTQAAIALLTCAYCYYCHRKLHTFIPITESRLD
jgi:hypothetical protein